jgi:hypothetical protein
VVSSSIAFYEAGSENADMQEFEPLTQLRACKQQAADWSVNDQ